MAELREREFLKCPYARARSYLDETLEPLATSGRESAMTLSLPLGDLAVRKEVTVTFRPGSDPRHFDEPWTVHWEPKGGGPYPAFDGTLTVRAAEDYDSAILELDGTYVPPLGMVGAAFDAVAGSRIATATAHTLLRSIGDRMEERYRREEAEKKSERDA